MLLRFRDLNERRIVANWPTLLRLIERHGFPAGIRLGPNMRAWPEAEIEAWLESRRIPSPAWRHLKHKPDPDLPQAPNPSGSRHADRGGRRADRAAAGGASG